jgi:hypothetical protein
MGDARSIITTPLRGVNALFTGFLHPILNGRQKMDRDLKAQVPKLAQRVKLREHFAVQRVSNL